MKFKVLPLLFLFMPLMLVTNNSFAKDKFVEKGPFVHKGVVFEYKAYVRTKNRKSTDRMLLIAVGNVWEMQEKFCGFFPDDEESTGFVYTGCNKSGKRCDRVTEYFNC